MGNIRFFDSDTDTVSDRSAGDRKRHREKVRNAIKENLGNIISEESIIGQSGDKKIKVPIKGVKEFRFIFGTNNPGVAQGSGDEKPGDVIPGSQERGSGTGSPGSEPGEDIYETEITLDELVELFFEDLELPDLERKRLQLLPSERLLKKKGYRRQGVRVRLSRKKTVVQRLKRRQATYRALSRNMHEMGDSLEGKVHEESEVQSPEPGLPTSNIHSKHLPFEKRFPFHQDDLRYSRVKPDIKHHSNAVIFCIMDTSGSMDMTKKYLARSFYFLLYRFILTRYQNVEVVFISHHTEAKEVTEEEFFHRGESGGTHISSGYKKALEIIESRYHPTLWNIYAFHCSDGDNFDEDNKEAIRSAQSLAEVANLFGYGEIKPHGSYSWSSMLELYKNIHADNFVTVKIHEKEDLWPAFRYFLGKEKIKEREKIG